MKAEEFDQRFDRGEDVTSALDLDQARRPDPGGHQRANRPPDAVDLPERPPPATTYERPPMRDQRFVPARY
jgi:hypothetical protein